MPHYDVIMVLVHADRVWLVASAVRLHQTWGNVWALIWRRYHLCTASGRLVRRSGAFLAGWSATGQYYMEATRWHAALRLVPNNNASLVLQNTGLALQKTRLVLQRLALQKRETCVADKRDLIESRVVMTRISRCYNTRLAGFFATRFSRFKTQDSRVWNTSLLLLQRETLAFATRDSLLCRVQGAGRDVTSLLP